MEADVETAMLVGGYFGQIGRAGAILSTETQSLNDARPHRSITGAAIPIDAYVGMTAMTNDPKHISSTDNISALRRP